MDREYVERHNVIERYHLGRLTEDEADEFEDLFVFDQVLRHEVEVAEKLIYGLKRNTQTLDSTAADHPSTNSFTSGRGLLFAACATVAIISSLIPYLYFKRQLSVREAYEQELLSSLAAEREPAVSGGIVALAQARSGETTTPVTNVLIPKGSDQNVVLAVPILDIEVSPLKLSLYRNGTLIWDDWIPNDVASLGTVHLTIPPTILQPGIYNVTVGPPSVNEPSALTKYSFRANDLASDGVLID